MIEPSLKDSAKMTVQEASELLQVAPRYIHVGLQQQRFPWGTAVKMSGRWSYYIHRGMFMAWLNKGEELPTLTEMETWTVKCKDCSFECSPLPSQQVARTVGQAHSEHSGHTVLMGCRIEIDKIQKK